MELCAAVGRYRGGAAVQIEGSSVRPINGRDATPSSEVLRRSCRILSPRCDAPESMYAMLGWPPIILCDELAWSRMGQVPLGKAQGTQEREVSSWGPVGDLPNTD